MLTKYTITIGSSVYAVPDECLANWDEISFSLKRTDYSGVMRSYSTQFVFVGTIRDLLWEHYLANGFNATASVAVHTITNTHEWEKQFEAPLDFSSLENEDGKLTINAIDNTLAARLKSMKGQKWQFPVSQFNFDWVNVVRMELANSAKFTLPNTSQAAGIVDVRWNEEGSSVISQEYIEPSNASSGYDGTSVQRFFADIVHAGAPTVNIFVQATVRCYLNADYAISESNDVAHLKFCYGTEGTTVATDIATLFDNDITRKRINGINRHMWIGNRLGSTPIAYATLDALKAAAALHQDGLYIGMFGVVGSYAYSSQNDDYWANNTIYEYAGGTEGWVSKGIPGTYYQDRLCTASASVRGLGSNNYLMLQLDEDMFWSDATLDMAWSDPARTSYAYSAIRPLELLQDVVSAISPGATATIAEDDAGLIAKTYLFPAEVLRKMGDSKVYTTFQQFADWMSAVFGYTYRIVDNEVQFVHRSEVFVDDDVKVIESFRDVKYSVNDNLIYSEVNAGYTKKEYGEINGRLEKNFTNYYSTGFSATDRKLSLISKYRADSYGIEFTLRKGEKQSDTTDDKADEDIFFLCAEVVSSSLTYDPANNDAYNPAVCVANNAGLIAAMGNGKAVTLSMTSSDGNNELEDIDIAAGTALFSAGELEFTTDDMNEPAVLDGLVRLDYQGYRYTGFIGEVKARFGRENGFDYTLIVKEIIAL